MSDGFDRCNSPLFAGLRCSACGREQPEQEWQGLTEEEIIEAVREADLDWHRGWTLKDGESNRYTTLARAIEAALKEKNK